MSLLTRVSRPELAGFLFNPEFWHGPMNKMTKMTHTKERRVSDLTLAAFFANRKHEIVRIEPNGGRSIFIFRATPELERDELAFFNRAATVDPLAFAETLRYLKGAVR